MRVVPARASQSLGSVASTTRNPSVTAPRSGLPPAQTVPTGFVVAVVETPADATFLVAGGTVSLVNRTKHVLETK